MRPLLQRLTSWLCLSTALLTGYTPAQGFVVCLQPGGRVSVDLSTLAERCNCCDIQEQGTSPEAQTARAPGDTCCECLDLPVSGSLQDRLSQPRPIAPQVGPWIAPSAGSLVQQFVSIAPAAHALRAQVPRAPDSLALIRSIVLLL